MRREDRKISEKPSPLVCPREFCFFWTEQGNWVATSIYENLGEALKDTGLVQDNICGCPLGVCKRLDPKNGDRDWYEPIEQKLEGARLPWFYFIPAPEILVVDRRAEYIRESELLWGREHWQK